MRDFPDFFKTDGFPDPLAADDPEGLVAVSDYMDTRLLLTAYSDGVFPWFEDHGQFYWFATNPRMVLSVQDFKPSKSLRRVVKSGRFEVRVDTDFMRVMACCASVGREGQDGSWISNRFRLCYGKLHKMGFAHSFETYEGGRLVGGLYGVSIGRTFCGESMFHTVTDASKVAFAAMVEFCCRHGIQYVDAQEVTPHLASLGAKPMPLQQFVGFLRQSSFADTICGNWGRHTLTLLLGSNQGDRQQLLEQAVSLIGSEVGMVSRRSNFYETEPWGFDSCNKFLNIAVNVETDMTPEQALEATMDIERRLGRRRQPSQEPQQPAQRHYEDRPIDIDHIFYDNIAISTPRLVLPHPRMHLRRFVLQPLADIMPHYRHPALRLSVAELLQQLAD